MPGNRLSDRGFTSTRGLSYTLEDTATNVDAALPASHGLGAVPSSLELWVEQGTPGSGEWEKHDAGTYLVATATSLVAGASALAETNGGPFPDNTNIRIVAAAGAVALSVAEASASQAGIVSTGTQTFAGAKTFSGAVSTDASHLGGYGLLPVGAIVAYNPGYYTNGSNGGFAISGPAGNSVAQVNAFLNGKGWYVCDGAALNNAASPIWNAAGRYLPNLDDGRFLRGSAEAGTQGGFDTFTLTAANIPTLTSTGSVTSTGSTVATNTGNSTVAHTHTINHGHTATSATAGAHNHRTVRTGVHSGGAKFEFGTVNAPIGATSIDGDVGYALRASSSTEANTGLTSTNGSHSHTITVNNHNGGSGPATDTTHSHSIPSLVVNSGQSVSVTYTNNTPSAVSNLPKYLSTYFIVRVF